MSSLISTLRHATVPLAALLALAGTGSAHALDFSFTAAGFGVTGVCAGGGSNCVEGFTVGDADDVGNTIAGSWAQFLNYVMTPSTGAISGTWSFTDTAASLNDLTGTFTGQWTQVSPGVQQATINYTVTGGEGLFAGAIGTGQSVLTATADFDYTETGSFSVSVVPEPATWALWAGGVAVTTAMARRRRRN